MKLLLPSIQALVLAVSLALPARAAQPEKNVPPALPKAPEIEKMAARFKPTPIKVDLSGLSAGDREALSKLIEASRVLDDLFLEQFWSGNREMLAKLDRDLSPIAKPRLHYFWINKGPWSELDGHVAFLPGVPSHKLPGANFYAEDVMKSEFESWVEGLPKAEQDQARSFFTVIRRDDAGKLTTVPYAREYKTWLDSMAALLREAAAKTESASLKTFLTARADALLSNDYYASDLAWMDLDAPIDVTFGPYETYNDDLYGYKASFEAYVNLRDERESARLAILSKHLQEIENALPVAPELRNPKLGAAAPIRVVNMVFNAGDAGHGVQAAAYNLPNDERVIQARGSKRVLLKNVQEAKFKQVLQPISQQVLAKEDRANVVFEPFFMHILAHELSHGLGLHQITVEGRQTTPRAELKDLYSTFEEARADVLGLFTMQYLMDNAERLELKGVVSTGANAEKQLYTTFLASSFRTLRFGAAEAHAKGMALQLNWLLDHKAVLVRPDGTFHVDLEKMKTAVRDLATELITLHATGNRAAAKKLLDQLGVIRPEVQKAIAKLQGVPTDIEPQFVTAQELVPEAGKAVPLHREEKVEIGGDDESPAKAP